MIRSYLFIFLSFLIALLATLVPLPFGIQWGRPEWMTLVLIYWLLAMPEYIGIISAWIIGLCIDFVYGSVLGQYAFSLAIVAYLINLLRSKMRLFPIWQPMLIILVVIGFEQLSILWVQWLIGKPPHSLWYWMSTLTSMLIWPVVAEILARYERRWIA